MSKLSTKITIREVAALAKVSVMTVSRVMRNEPQVAAATRQLVHDAIKSLRYEPLQSARNLSSSVAKVVGLVAPHGDPLKSGYEYFSALHLGALQVCAARDYGLMLLMQSDDVDIAERMVRRVQARQIGGYVIAAPLTETPGLLTKLGEAGVVHASINPLDVMASGSWVTSGDRAATTELASHLAAQGHRSIAYVGGNMAIRACRERLAGYQETLKHLKLKTRKAWVIATGISFEDGLAAGRILLDRADRPTAVQCMTDDLAAGVIAAAHERGLRLPAELSVVGFDNYGLARKVWPALTTAHLPVEEMAAHATAQVIGALEGHPIENREFDCPTWIRASG